MFSPALPEHVYQSCFSGGAGDWSASLSCPSLKFENLWDTHMMKNWNPSVLLQEPLPGDVRPSLYLAVHKRRPTDLKME